MTVEVATPGQRLSSRPTGSRASSQSGTTPTLTTPPVEPRSCGAEIAGIPAFGAYETGTVGLFYDATGDCAEVRR